MLVDVVISHASGRAFDDCVFLAHRGSESRVLAVRRNTSGVELGARLGGAGRLTALWASDEGAVWVGAADGAVLGCDAAWGEGAGRWVRQELGFVAKGITGGRGDVFVYGSRASDGRDVIAMYDGVSWKPLPGPDLRFHTLVGARETLWAAGPDGIACFDGAGAWEILEDVQLAAAAAAIDGDDVVLARDDGVLLAASADGAIQELGRGPASPKAVVSWQGSLWVGAGPAGLWRVDGAGAVCVRADRHAVQLEGRDQLLAACGALVSGSSDGEKFPGLGRGAWG